MRDHESAAVGALAARFTALPNSVALDGNRRAPAIADNLFVEPEAVRAEYEAAAGNEWPDDIRSVRSSAALTTNLFAPLRETARDGGPNAATLLGQQVNWEALRIEHRFSTGAHGGSTNLDAFIPLPPGGRYEAVAAEVKLAEYFKKTTPP